MDPKEQLYRGKNNPQPEQLYRGKQDAQVQAKGPLDEWYGSVTYTSQSDTEPMVYLVSMHTGHQLKLSAAEAVRLASWINKFVDA